MYMEKHILANFLASLASLSFIICPQFILLGGSTGSVGPLPELSEMQSLVFYTDLLITNCLANKTICLQRQEFSVKSKLNSEQGF